MERSAKEITLFALACAGIWVGVWAVLLTNLWIGALALALIVIGLGGFSAQAE